MKSIPEQDSRLVLITSPEPIPNEAAILEALLETGLSHLYIRKPGAEKAVVRELVGALSPRFYSRLLLSAEFIDESFCRLAGGFHVPELMRRHVRLAVLQDMKAKTGYLTTSIHRAGDYQSLSACFDAVFFSPVYDSISKQGYKAMPAKEWEVLSYKRNMHILALGGISAATLGKVMTAGFDGAAVMGAVWQAEDPVKACKELQEVMKTSVRMP